METEFLTAEERRVLLQLARQAIEAAVCGQNYLMPDLTLLPPRMVEKGNCFVTLTTRSGELRGCIGGLEAVQPLALDICEHAVAAALEDYRFNPICPEELPGLRIEISRLTAPEPIEYDDPAELPGLIHPPYDGVVLRDGLRRATFLPQVWEKLPDPRMFLSQLCLKMGVPGDLWCHKVLQVEIYHIEEFREED
jgi:uncharacterized protein